MSPSYAHLRLHSEYALVDGIVRLEALAERLKAYQMPAVALTDPMNLFAMVKFVRQMTSLGIKPIIGADIRYRSNDKTYTATILCKNKHGYQCLLQLLSRGYLEGQVSQGPEVEWEWISQLSNGLIVLLGAESDLGESLIQGQLEQAEQILSRWQACFPEHCYLLLQRCGRSHEEIFIQRALPLAERFEVPVVAANDVRFLEREDFEAHEARVAIHDGYVLADPKRPRRYTEDQYLKSTDEMVRLFQDIPEAIENSVYLAERCTVPVQLGEVFLPRFPVPEGVSESEFLTQQSEKGLLMRLAQHKSPKYTEEEYQSRLTIELGVIVRMGFSGYFLIVADFIAWAKSQKIPVGPGRGSGAGSLVAYVLGITELDPLEHDLLFERFLNPERVSMPDFDVDFCMENRDRVIEYVVERYGQASVAQIITYGSMAAKAVVRDVGRVLGHPYGFVDKIAKLIPFELGITLEKALVQEEILAQRYNQEEDVRTLIDLARKLEGVPRNAGKHAGGVVIAPTRLTDFVPLFCESGGHHQVTQWDKDDVEAIGLVKFDFLGLRTLTIIDWSLQTINTNRERQGLPLIDIQRIPLDDEAAFRLIQQHDTTAVFQLESRGIKELTGRLRPDCFEDMVALVALYRPGPLQSGMVEDFINRKHGRAPVNYLHDALTPVLKPTYGVILYQEQVMQIAQVLAGYSLGEADILRRAMGKKKPEEMAKQRAIFLKGASERGVDADLAAHVFDLMEKFAGYGFNKSHSAAYAQISYQTAWLKAHYPSEFMAAVLSSDMDNTEKVASLVSECRKMGLTILPPDVNHGDYHFKVREDGAIIYGLGAIKGVGEAVIAALVEDRTAQGAYTSLFDLCERLSGKLTRRTLEPFIRSGAMDGFRMTRAGLWAILDKALKRADQNKSRQMGGQMDLLGGVSEDPILSATEQQVPEWDLIEKLKGEKEVLGHYQSGHPFAAYEAELKSWNIKSIDQLTASGEEATRIAGMISQVRSLITKTGKKMAIVVLEDATGRIEMTLFSEAFQSAQMDLVVDQVVVVTGVVLADEYTGGVRLRAQTVQRLSSLRAVKARQLDIHVHDEKCLALLIETLPALLSQASTGSCHIRVHYRDKKGQAQFKLGRAFQISLEESVLKSVQTQFGYENVKVHYQ